MLNLITEPWIPVRFKDGSSRSIAPWQIADPDAVRPDWPRADFNAACLELLIGLVFLADPPEDSEDWEERQRPDPDRLRERISRFEMAFNLVGVGPQFLQDLSPLDGEAHSPDMLFIDSAGGNTARNNADVMVRRGRYVSLDPATAAMALYCFQANAPSGGAGNRTSMRGGGPMVTLVQPSNGLWSLVWANVPDGRPASPGVLPWTRPTVTSEKESKVWPEHAHPGEAFFGMPRRLRLVSDSGRITGVIQRPHGTNYAGWVHPLTPYYRMRPGDELLAQHPRAGRFGYRNWLGVVASNPDGGLRERAKLVAAWSGRSRAEATVIVSGWAMDNMKPRDFTWSEAPLIDLPDDAARRLVAMVEVAESISLALRRALATVVAEGELREALREAFFSRTQAAFDSRVRGMTVAEPEEAGRGWISDLRQVAMDIFEARALPGLDQRRIEDQRSIIAAHSSLMATFAGRTKTGREAWGRLGLAPPPIRKEEPA